MYFLDIWKHPEIFKDVDFSELDAKIKFIQKIRKEHEIYNKVIKELNNRIDIDFIKDSELIEGNSVVALEGINYDEDYEEIYETNIFETKVKDAKITDDFFFGEYRTILKNGRLVIYRKDPKTGNIYQYKCGMPKHLKALKKALDTARKEKALIEDGENVPVTGKFIENLHETLFEDYIFINTRLNKIPGGPLIKPEGYGMFRKTIFINGNEHKYNVEVEDAGWVPTDSDDVISEMNQLLEYYNNSNLHPILKAILFKSCFIRIHPFRDGNGRTSRILLNYMLVRNGIPTVRIRGTHKDEYFEALDNSIINADYSQMINLVKEELNNRCDQYLSLILKLNITEEITKTDDLLGL